jgi:hypothetical protein
MPAFPIGRCPEADREYNGSRISIGEQMPFIPWFVSSQNTQTTGMMIRLKN